MSVTLGQGIVRYESLRTLCETVLTPPIDYTMASKTPIPIAEESKQGVIGDTPQEY